MGGGSGADVAHLGEQRRDRDDPRRCAARVGATDVVVGDVDHVQELADRAGSEIVGAARDPVRFRRGYDACSLRDAEGNVWTFGTYRGAP